MKRSLLPLLLLTSLLAGCEISTSGTSGDWTGGPTPPPVLLEEMRVTDLVKLISPDIGDGDDASTFDQSSFVVNSRRRLLLSYTDLGNNMGTIDTGHGGKVIMEITLDNPLDTVTAETNIKLCPLTSAWSLVANWIWTAPHTRWNTPGGDFDTIGCVSGTHIKPLANSQPDATPDPQATPAPVPEPDGHIYFDVTSWYLNFVKGRGINFGLAVLSNAELRIYGSRSGESSPRIYWDERDR